MSNVLDPTKTTTIRRKFVADMRGRITRMKQALKYALVDQDLLGLSFVRNQELNDQTKYETDADKILALAAFIDALASEYYLDTSSSPWFEEYTVRGYRRGIENAYHQLQRSGYSNVRGLSGAPKDYMVQLIMGMAATQSYIKVANARILTDLRTYTSAIAQASATALMSVLQKNESPKQLMFIVNQRMDHLSNKRAFNIAKNEVIRAHAEAQLTTYEMFGVDQVLRVSESVVYQTVGDNRVCPICAPFEGRRLPIAEARGLIPQHPQCRCSWSVPVRK